MKRHKGSGSCLPASSRCLGNVCGTNIDTEDLDFSRSQGNLVYMDKIFSYTEDTSCPVLFNLFTGGNQSNNFTTELTLDGGRCNLIPCTLSRNAVFNIENSYVVVEYFNTRPPGNISPNQVTVDGFPVNSISYENGRYTARTAGVNPRIQNDRCLERGIPTKVFFLVNNAGPWDFRAKYILEGTVNTDGRNCCFRLEISHTPNSPNTSVPSGNVSNFAIPELSLPCTIDGVAPDIVFQFRADIHMVNPRLYVDCGNGPGLARTEEIEATRGVGSCPPPCPPCPPPCPCPTGECNVFLETRLAIEPTIHVETIRKTLFCVNACEALKPCDGSVTEAERENLKECVEDVADRPNCFCHNCSGRVGDRDLCEGKDRDRDCDRDDGRDSDRGRGRRRDRDCDRDDDRDCDRDDRDSDRDCDRRRDRDRNRGRSRDCDTTWNPPCGNRTVGGVTIGTGPCDCNDRDNRDRSDRDNFCGEELLAGICEALCGDDEKYGPNCEGLGRDGTFGCGDVRGIGDRDRDKGRDRDGSKCKDEVRGRTAFQYHGCNGCSW